MRLNWMALREKKAPSEAEKAAEKPNKTARITREFVGQIDGSWFASASDPKIAMSSQIKKSRGKILGMANRAEDDSMECSGNLITG
jgi:hypothetical protein